jgi:hypothetical protein
MYVRTRIATLGTHGAGSSGHLARSILVFEVVSFCLFGRVLDTNFVHAHLDSTVHPAVKK